MTVYYLRFFFTKIQAGCWTGAEKSNVSRGKGMEKSQNNLKLFENKKIRYVWNAEEEWYFSVVDIVEVLTGTQNPRRYWSDLKIKLTKEGSELYDKIVQLKLIASDGKLRETDVLSTKNVLRLIQSIPSPKAEPFKMWLAEASATEISQNEKPTNLRESAQIAVSGAEVALDARKSLEKRGGKTISSQNAKEIGDSQLSIDDENQF